MPRLSLFDRYELFVAAGVLGAHANTLNRGFRQNDVRFVIEIFTNWMDFVEENSTLIFQNTQVARYLESLVEDGFARKRPQTAYPLYRLTRSGLIELISRVVDRDYYQRRAHFYFVFFFISAYRTRIIQLVKMEGKRFPYSLQAELERLLDPEVVADRELGRAKAQLKKLDKRIDEQMQTKALVEDLQKQGVGFQKLVTEVERRFPYGLNTQKRYADIFEVGTERQALWELTSGNVMRAEQIWLPARRELELHIEQVGKLRADFIAKQQRK